VGAPDSDLERRIGAILAEILELDAVGRHDNFFDLGATSLHLVQVRRRLAQELGRDVPVVEILQHPSLAQLAGALAGPDAADGKARAAEAPAWKRGFDRGRRRREAHEKEGDHV
jgi:acyl carrier protein